MYIYLCRMRYDCGSRLGYTLLYDVDNNKVQAASDMCSCHLVLLYMNNNNISEEKRREEKKGKQPISGDNDLAMPWTAVEVSLAAHCELLFALFSY